MLSRLAAEGPRGLALAGLTAGLAGCLAPQSDLSEPWRRQEAAGGPVAVATAGRMLPVVTDETGGGYAVYDA